MDPRLLNPLIHIGYHKTGSTWLQKYLFDCPERGFFRLSGKYLSKNHIGLRPATRFARKFVFEPGGSFYSLNEFSPDRMRELLGECKVRGSAIPVLSDERLSGHPETGGFDCQEICNRLAQVFDSPKIFIVIREQKSLIVSCYMDFLLKGGTLSLSEYVNSTCKRSPRFRRRYLMFYDLVIMYQKFFGKENVLVLPYEIFRDDPEVYFKKLASFSGAVIPETLPIKDKVNARTNTFIETRLRYLNLLSMDGSPYSEHTFYLGKFFHKLCRSLKKRLAKVVPDSLENKERVKQKQFIEDSIGNYYKENNLKTSDLIGIDLEQYNY